MAVSERVKTLVNSKIRSIPNRELYKHTRYLILARGPTLIHLLSSANKKKNNNSRVPPLDGSILPNIFPIPNFPTIHTTSTIPTIPTIPTILIIPITPFILSVAITRCCRVRRGSLATPGCGARERRAPPEVAALNMLEMQ